VSVKCPKCHHDNPDDTIYCGKYRIIAEVEGARKRLAAMHLRRVVYE